MNAIKVRWQKLGAVFDAKAQRERLLLAVVAVGGVLLLGNSLFVDPTLAKVRQVKTHLAQQDAELSTVQSQTNVVRGQLQADPDAARKADIVRLNARLQELERDLKALEDRFVPPEQMNSLLDSLLSNNARLRLLSLKSLAPVNLADAVKVKTTENAVPVANPLGLYKHGVELRLEGSYADLYTWLAQLETSQKKILWGDVRFVVTEHPRSVMTLVVYTLSTDKAWLSI